MRPVINTTKHYVQTSLATVTSGASTNFNLAVAVQAPDANLSNEVREGSVIKKVYLEYWLRAEDAVGGTVLITFYKRESGAGPINFANQTALYSYNNKKNVFRHAQGLSNDQNSTATPFFREWIRIPVGKQRFGAGDVLAISIAAQSQDQVVCGFVTYKEEF